MGAIRHISISILVPVLLTIGQAAAAPHHIDTAHSTLTVRAYKAGVLAAMGHDHEISAPIAGGTVDVEQRMVELRVNASALKVRDTKGSEKDKAEIQSTMLGPEVLDAEHHSEIVFRSKSADPAGDHAWKVHGELTLHGETRPVEVEVREAAGRYTGSAELRQTEFGIKPVKAAGGAVKVKDEIRIEFDIRLAP